MILPNSGLVCASVTVNEDQFKRCSWTEIFFHLIDGIEFNRMFQSPPKSRAKVKSIRVTGMQAVGLTQPKALFSNSWVVHRSKKM